MKCFYTLSDIHHGDSYYDERRFVFRAFDAPGPTFAGKTVFPFSVWKSPFWPFWTSSFHPLKLFATLWAPPILLPRYPGHTFKSNIETISFLQFMQCLDYHTFAIINLLDFLNIQSGVSMQASTNNFHQYKVKYAAVCNGYPIMKATTHNHPLSAFLFSWNWYYYYHYYIKLLCTTRSHILLCTL